MGLVSVGVRSGDPAADSTLRDYLVAWYCDLRQTYMNTARKGSDEELERYVKAQWTPLIDALLDGEAIEFHRFELPPDHPQAPPHGGNPTDTLELGSDDVLRPVVSTGPRFVPPNRAQRRAMGQRNNP
jgi:hypothetical protein